MTFPREAVEPLVIEGVPEDTRYIGDRLEQEIALLEQLVAATISQENPSPALIRFFGAVGASASNIVSDTPRWRATGIIITPGGYRRITLKVGTAALFVFDLAGQGETRYFPFPEMFDGGVDIQFTANGVFNGDGFFAYIIGYPETTP